PAGNDRRGGKRRSGSPGGRACLCTLDPTVTRRAQDLLGHTGKRWDRHMGVENGRKYLDPKVLDKLTRLDLRARLVVEGFLTGQHKSPYHGFAVEFATHREYVPGDETKHIDWKVWSKTDRFYIKEYEEETNLKCTIVLDASKSMRYGREHGPSKFDYAATLAA